MSSPQVHSVPSRSPAYSPRKNLDDNLDSVSYTISHPVSRTSTTQSPRHSESEAYFSLQQSRNSRVRLLSRSPQRSHTDVESLSNGHVVAAVKKKHLHQRNWDSESETCSRWVVAGTGLQQQKSARHDYDTMSLQKRKQLEVF